MFVFWISCFLCCFVLFFVFLILTFIHFDRILKAIYGASKVEWERLGRPLGFFWSPKEASPFSLSSTGSRSKLLNDVLYGGESFSAKYAELENETESIRRYYRFVRRMLLLMFLLFIIAAIASVFGRVQ